MGFSRQEYWSGVPLPSPYRAALLLKTWLIDLGPSENCLLLGHSETNSTETENKCLRKLYSNLGGNFMAVDSNDEIFLILLSY